MAADKSPSCERLSRHLMRIRTVPLSDHLLDRAKLLILDNLGCAIAGAQTRAGQAVLQGLTRLERPTLHGSYTTDASPERYTPAIAAAISGMMANALDYDDTLYGHPGSVIVPTALTTSHYLNASGGDVLSAVVAGYEVAGRLGKACSPSAESRKLAWGIGSRHAPAAAATTALLLKLDLNQTAHALAISASNSPVSSINKTVYSSLGPTMSKNNFAMSIMAGVTGACLAEAGFTGPLDIFDGETGWWRMIGSDEWRPEPSLTTFTDFDQVLQVEFKPYPCCRFIHSTIEAILQLIRDYAIIPEDILRVDVRTFSWVTTGAFAERRPIDMPSAQFSIPYCTAVALSGRAPGPRWYDEQTMSDPMVHHLADRVHLHPWPEADSLHTEQWLAEVTITTHEVQKSITIRYPLGHPNNPMDLQDTIDKFLALTGPILGDERSRQLHQLIVTLDQLENVDSVWSLIHP